jgi:LPS-assembly protein
MKTVNMIYFRRLLILVLTVICFGQIAGTAMAQQNPVSVVADSIKYTKATGILLAQGNIKVYFEDSVLAAETIKYNQNTNQIEIIGPFTLKNGDSTTLSGRDTVMDAKLQTGLILGARALIDQQMQIAAQQLDRVDSNTSVFQTVVTSTCHVCADNPTPFWQIRAKRIIHEKQLKKLYFESAVLDFFGVPVFYIPKLSIPEPGVKRASGFLVPQFSTSNTLGVTAKIPYYIAINDRSDATITPFISLKGSVIIESEYRRRTKNGAYQLSGAIALADQLDQGGVSAFIEGKGLFNLKNDYQLEYGIDFANSVDLASGEKSFKSNFDYSDDDRLKSFVQISKTKDDSYFQVGASFTQSFRYKNFDGDAAGTLEEDPNVPIVLPEFYFRRNFDDTFLGGKFGVTAQSVTLLDSSSGRYSRIGTRFDWQRYWHLNSGLVVGAAAQVNANAYLTQSGNYGNMLPVTSVELRYPMQRTVGKLTHVIEPIAQLIWAPDEAFGTVNTDANTSDSTTAEFEETNLFSINRFPGFDETEAGLRANVGVQYLLHNPNNWEISATAGRVFRAKNLNQFDTFTSTGLDRRNSDYVGAFTLRYPNKFSLSSRLLFDKTLSASKNETKLAFRYKKVDMNLGYVWIEKDTVLNNNERQHEASLSTSYQIDDNWSFSADWRQNLSTHSPIEGELGIDYENECAKVNFSLSLEYDEDGNVDRSFGMTVSLAGLGSNNKSKITKRRCGF